MKIAIIHDWLVGTRGGEKCLEVFCELFPEADIFTIVHKKGAVSEIIERMPIKTSFIQKLPKSTTWYRNYLPLFPKAVESFDLSGYDVILSSSHCAAKGVRVGENALHICYCYTPMRYVWLFFDEYFGNTNFIKKQFIRLVSDSLKKWDLKTNKSVDYFIAISDNVRNRIRNIYSRDSYVIYPPVDLTTFSLSSAEGDYYLLVSAPAPYKRADLAIEAFNQNGKKLIVIGSDSLNSLLIKKSKSNVHFTGYADTEKLCGYYAGCKALIFPGEEDFGIVPVEAQACGKPVIAYAKGGALETVIPINPRAENLYSGPFPTGVFFYNQTVKDLNNAINIFEENKNEFISEKIRENAFKFSRDLFKENIKRYIYDKISQKRK